MSEHDVLRATPGGPATAASLARDLRALGLRHGDVVLAHTSLSSLGWVVGGPVAVVMALEVAVGDGGTLVMPTQTTSLVDPQAWRHPPAPEAWWSTIRDHMPPYDRHTTPSVGVGVVPEVFRTRPGVRRSGHPLYSFAARGPRAGQVTADHPLSFGLGDTSPLGRLYEMDARVLLLGVDGSANTALHLCEYRLDVDRRRRAPVRVPVGTDPDGITRWASLDDIELDEGDFARLTRDFEAHAAVRTGPVGAGVGRLMNLRQLVDFGMAWMQEHRDPPA